jgi:8-oxo-dGTP pyrophosphatase MutT (NUDIX family)
VLLVTTRRSGRWIVPKGRAKKGCTPARTAKIEALEEAGVVGAVARKSIGSFEMKSRFVGRRTKANDISVFPLAVRRQHETWKEQGQRHRRWLTLKQAVRTVHPGGLSDILKAFEQMLRRKVI